MALIFCFSIFLLSSSTILMNLSAIFWNSSISTNAGFNVLSSKFYTYFQRKENIPPSDRWSVYNFRVPKCIFCRFHWNKFRVRSSRTFFKFWCVFVSVTMAISSVDQSMVREKRCARWQLPVDRSGDRIVTNPMNDLDFSRKLIVQMEDSCCRRFRWRVYILLVGIEGRQAFSCE